MPEDQAHEQNNKTIKIDGGAIGILDNATALIKWMIAGPEIARLLEYLKMQRKKRTKTLAIMKTLMHMKSAFVKMSFHSKTFLKSLVILLKRMIYFSILCLKT